MKEKIKKIGWVGLTVFVVAIGFLVPVILIKGSTWAVTNYHSLINAINGYVFIFVIVLLLLSFIPSIRSTTGGLIFLATKIWGILFWINCLFITYALWGFFGAFIGIMGYGMGIFATAPIALIFKGQWKSAFIVILNIAFIYGIRLLGLWIFSKHKVEEPPYYLNFDQNPFDDEPSQNNYSKEIAYIEIDEEEKNV